MKKLKAFVESQLFQNVIICIIVFNSIIMGLQTSPAIVESIGDLLNILDAICLGIFVVELLLKLIVYRLHFFTSGWNIFDLIIVILSMFSGMSFLSTFRVFRIFRVLRSLKAAKALKGLRAFRLVSGVDKLRVIIGAIGRSIPGIAWSAALLLLIYYIFSIIGVTLFSSAFVDWFGTIGKSMYTLFQVMTLESWSMGISRPVMEVFPWAWMYFVPFVLITSFVVMNVVVGIVVNSISEVTAINEKEKEQNKLTESPESVNEQLKHEIESLRKQLDQVELLLTKSSE